MLRQLAEKNKEVAMAASILFVNELPLIVIVSIKLRFTMAEHVPKIKEGKILILKNCYVMN